MSYVELHTGSLRKVEENFSIEELESFLQNNHVFEVDNLERKKEKNTKFLEIFNKETGNMVFVWHKNSFYEIVSHNETDEVDYLLDVKKGEGDIVNFTLIFHNGGTYFSEMLEEGLDKL